MLWADETALPVKIKILLGPAVCGKHHSIEKQQADTNTPQMLCGDSCPPSQNSCETKMLLRDIKPVEFL